MPANNTKTIDALVKLADYCSRGPACGRDFTRTAPYRTADAAEQFRRWATSWPLYQIDELQRAGGRYAAQLTRLRSALLQGPTFVEVEGDFDATLATCQCVDYLARKAKPIADELLQRHRNQLAQRRGARA